MASSFTSSLIWTASGKEYRIGSDGAEVVSRSDCRWEHPSRLSVNNIIDTPPPCLLDFADRPGYSQMHVWVSDYIVFC